MNWQAWKDRVKKLSRRESKSCQQALTKSIAHWRAICAVKHLLGLSNGVLDMNAENCALCGVYRSSANVCGGCPLNVTNEACEKGVSSPWSLARQEVGSVNASSWCCLPGDNCRNVRDMLVKLRRILNAEIRTRVKKTKT